MKMFMTSFFSFLALTAVSFTGLNSAEANAEGPAYVCRIQGKISGASIGIGVGGQYVGGEGVISCETASGGNLVQVPVRMKLIGAGWGWNFTVIKSMDVVSAGIGVMNGPEALLQTYALGATAGATLGQAGVDFDMAVKVSGEGGVGFELGFKGKEAIGLGARLHAMMFSIEPLN